MLPKLPSCLPPKIALKFMKTYLSVGDLNGARKMFDKIPNPDLRILTVLISEYTKQGLPRESIKLYLNLCKQRNIPPDRLILLSVAKACAALGDLSNAKEIHEDAMRFGLESDLLLGNVLIDMYGKCGFSEGAQRVFDGLVDKDVVSWTSLISSYVNCRASNKGLEIFRNMLASQTKPNSVTISTILSACSELKAVNYGGEIHCYSLKNGFDDDVFVCSGLVNMYAACSFLRNARIIFDAMQVKDVVSWNVILSAYFSSGDTEEALSIFNRMRTERTAMDSTSWNCMISGLAQNRKAEQAFKMFSDMQALGFRPTHVTIASLLPACASLENLRVGREIHAYIYRCGFTEKMTNMTALALMYAKCGDLEKSRCVFDEMPKKDTVAWNTMILANSMHGCGNESLLLFHQMIQLGLKPNPITFMVVLSGCSHAHLVEEGRLIFNSMREKHGIEPSPDHYACMVDILSRSGHLQEAYGLIQTMPIQPTASAWGALLASCRVYKNVELARIASQHLFELEPQNAGSYVLLSNILVAAKLWDDASKVRVMMRDKGISKTPGCSWIHVKNKVFTFVKGDGTNEQTAEIYNFLEEISKKMRIDGYVPNTDYVLQDVGLEEKEQNLCSHSEKLAVAFGLINLNGESRIRVFKNLRICGDCHDAIKYMAKITKVQIIVRDNLRFHHFQDGTCSCGDRW